MFSVKTTLTRTKTTTIPHQQQTISMRKKQRHQQHKNHCGGGGSGSGGCGGDGGCFIGAIIQVLCLQNCDDNGCSFKKKQTVQKIYEYRMGCFSCFSGFIHHVAQQLGEWWVFLESGPWKKPRKHVFIHGAALLQPHPGAVLSVIVFPVPMAVNYVPIPCCPARWHLNQHTQQGGSQSSCRSATRGLKGSSSSDS